MRQCDKCQRWIVFPRGNTTCKTCRRPDELQQKLDQINAALHDILFYVETEDADST